jgi:2-polyprenyl-6-methoxyphenol hydroxylase-like FAD-dependent oxidoreductase
VSSHTLGRRHVAVIGGGVAGLLAGRVLADHFERVTVIERDAKPVDAAPRSGAPQGRQTHVLLPAGAAILNRLFPQLLQQLIAAGSNRFDYGHSRFHLSGGWMPKVDTGLCTYAQTRPLLESLLRCATSCIRNVDILYSTVVTDIRVCDTPNRVCGILIRARPRQAPDLLEADLVIDASGRASRLARWITAHGFGAVPEHRLNIDVGYATALFLPNATAPPERELLYIVGKPPQHTKVGALIKVERGLVHVGLAGYNGDHPPGDEIGFVEFARSLCQPDVYEFVRAARLVGQIERFRVPAAVWKDYGAVRSFPAGVLPLGDAFCCLDPVFAQGMTAAAQHALALDGALRNTSTWPRTKRAYFRAANAVLRAPWGLAVGELMKYPWIKGPRPWLFDAAAGYKERLATCGDPVVVRNLYRVLTLSARQSLLAKPTILARALGGNLRQRFGYPA